MKIDLDKEFAVAVRAIGGSSLGDAPKGTFPGKNADFYFDEYKVVAELKCLDIDQIKQRAMSEKAGAIYADALRKRKAPRVLFGTCTETSEGYPEDYQRRFAELYEVPLRRVLRDADRQIRETKASLGVIEALGLLLLANNENMALDPSHILHLLGNALRDPSSFSCIDYVIFFTPNLHFAVDGYKAHVWIAGGRRDHAKIPEALEERLRAAWTSRHSEITGEPIVELSGNSVSMDALKNSRE